MPRGVAEDGLDDDALEDAVDLCACTSAAVSLSGERVRGPELRLGSGEPYFPREVFFFGFGLAADLAASGDFFVPFFAAMAPPFLVTRGRRLSARSRRNDRCRAPADSVWRRSSSRPACQSTAPSSPIPETPIANGCESLARPATVARRCSAVSLSQATAASRLSQHVTRQIATCGCRSHATVSWSVVERTRRSPRTPVLAACVRERLRVLIAADRTAKPPCARLPRRQA